MVPLAYMPQHVWEVGASVLAATIVVQGLVFLVRGRAPWGEGWKPKTVRMAAGVIVLGGVGIGLAAVLVEAEPPGAHSRDQWGGTTGVVFLGIWVVLMLAFPFLPSKRARPPR